MPRLNARLIDFKAESGYFLRYAVIGVCNTAMDSGIFYIGYFHLHLPILVANTLSYSLVFCLSFCLNRAWAFRQAAGGRSLKAQFLRFFAVSACGLLVANAVIWSLALILPAMLAKLVSIGAAIGVTFLGYRLLVFGKAPARSLQVSNRG